jgi:hypothetical protein
MAEALNWRRPPELSPAIQPYRKLDLSLGREMVRDNTGVGCCEKTVE